ncbi:transposase [Testudinibacter sp. TR-2022]|nr:transposase [Pasteurellaceae bacterium Phil11]TNH23452.1 transposase [Testudinibacter sp. TR-2022]TNH28744.1 transposase [Testudinibacter sp. TR-2022]
MIKQHNQKPIRRKMRLPCYDYNEAGCYFITICIHQRRNLLGQIQNGIMLLNAAGKETESILISMEKRYQDCKLAEYIIMPNHIHFIWINELGKTNLPDAIKWLKVVSTNAYIRGVKNDNWLPFHQRLWQRGYYDHIIRNEQDYEIIAEYIENNPLQWELDKLYQIDLTP